jgi:hypothetical protein
MHAIYAIHVAFLGLITILRLNGKIQIMKFLVMQLLQFPVILSLLVQKSPQDNVLKYPHSMAIF